MLKTKYGIVVPTLGPSPAILEAHIQLHEALTSDNAVIRAHMRLVIASPTVIRPCAAPLMSPLIGCSPIDVRFKFKLMEKWKKRKKEEAHL